MIFAIGELVPDAKRIKFRANFEALQALKDPRVEAFMQDFVLLYSLLQKNRGLKKWRVSNLSALDDTAVRKGDNEWLGFINATLTCGCLLGVSSTLFTYPSFQ